VSFSKNEHGAVNRRQLFANEPFLKIFGRVHDGEERDLLEATARSLLMLQDRVAGMEMVLKELVHANGTTEIALARLRIRADLLRLKGTPSSYLDAFLRS
jgi:hypothetical protein